MANESSTSELRRAFLYSEIPGAADVVASMVPATDLAGMGLLTLTDRATLANVLPSASREDLVRFVMYCRDSSLLDLVPVRSTAVACALAAKRELPPKTLGKIRKFASRRKTSHPNWEMLASLCQHLSPRDMLDLVGDADLSHCPDTAADMACVLTWCNVDADGKMGDEALEMVSKNCRSTRGWLEGVIRALAPLHDELCRVLGVVLPGLASSGLRGSTLRGLRKIDLQLLSWPQIAEKVTDTVFERGSVEVDPEAAALLLGKGRDPRQLLSLADPECEQWRTYLDGLLAASGALVLSSRREVVRWMVHFNREAVDEMIEAALRSDDLAVFALLIRDVDSPSVRRLGLRYADSMRQRPDREFYPPLLRLVEHCPEVNWAAFTTRAWMVDLCVTTIQEGNVPSLAGLDGLADPTFRREVARQCDTWSLTYDQLLWFADVPNVLRYFGSAAVKWMPLFVMENVAPDRRLTAVELLEDWTGSLNELLTVVQSLE